MDYVLLYRATLSPTATVTKTLHVDTANMPLLIAYLIVYSISGTGATITIQMESSDDLETWTNLGATFNSTTAIAVRSAFLASTAPYGRFVRASITLSGTAAIIAGTVGLRTFTAS